ncbi:type II toxin-antitoxin system VapC family toxin [candidate division KSB1 bacterium]|nr:type II toxin-antitoxin system VapC family toxin [candidate division KSB1 bacterium]
MNVFVDTSAFVKLYHHEAGTETLFNFLYRHSEDLILSIADITVIELHSAFLRRVRMGEIAVQIAQSVFTAVDKDLKFINSIELDTPAKQMARKLLDEVAPTKNLRTLDALQLAAAILENHILPIDYFVSADGRLLDIAAEYFDTFNPAKESLV